MDEHMMLLWIEKCLLSWKDTLQPEVTPLLILDSFYIYMIGPIDGKIQHIGIDVHILVPTNLCGSQ